MMIRFIIAAFLLISLSGCGDALTVSNDSKSEQKQSEFVSENFAKFIAEYNKLTEVQKDSKWAELNGKKVRWSGTVHDASSDVFEKGKFKVIVHLGGTDFVVARLDQVDKATLESLSKGDKITVQGTLSEPGGLVKSWVITNASIVK